MIGKQMADKLLDGRTLEFYQWGGEEPKEALLPNLRDKVRLEPSAATRSPQPAARNPQPATHNP